MKTKLSLPFKCKKLLMNPCKKLLQLFKFKKPLFIKALRIRKHNTKPKTTHKRNRFACLIKPFISRKYHRGMDRVMELKSFSESGTQKAPCPSPLTPAYVKKMCSKGSGEDEVEDACRSFENYLVEMIVEEGKTKDLTDVEELLYCWNHLKCPIFTGLVCRFYGELCKDLFSVNNRGDIDSPN